MRLQYAPYWLKFKEPACTSRGVLTEKLTCFLRVFDENDPSRYGLGEAAVFEGLSPEAGGRYELKLLELVANIALGLPTDLSEHSSIQFGLEQAFNDFASGCQGRYFDSDFIYGKSEIEINGLVWMGDYDRMLERLHKKVEEGFKCIKLKIGAIDWEKEVELIKVIRHDFSEHRLMIRVDANGGFSPDDVMPKLYTLAMLGVHSIEQPIPAGNPDAMASICESSPLPVALDEELIGKFTSEQRLETLQNIYPGFIILKPALCGGFSGAYEWLSMAEELGIGWWVTSALESNVGLDAIAQWTAYIGAEGPQGLGTGALFTNNFKTPVYLDSDRLRYNPDVSLDRSRFDSLDWRG